MSQSNAKLLKKIFPLCDNEEIMNKIKFSQSSNGFKILSIEYLLDNLSQFHLYPHDFTEIVCLSLSNNVLSSKYFDDLILDKNNFIRKLSSLITPDNQKDVELAFVRFTQKNPEFNNFREFFIKNTKQSNPIALFKEIPLKTFEELNENYDLNHDVVLSCIDYCYQRNLKKHGIDYDGLFNDLKMLTQTLHPCLDKQHLAHIISFNNDFMSFCKPIFLNMKFEEKFSEEKSFEPKKMKI